MSTAIAKKPLRQVSTVRELLVNDMAKGQLAAVAAAHMKPERMMRLMANAIRTTPKLAECDPMSLLGGMMTCAGLGLEPNTVLGHAYLIPFRNKRKGITEVQVVIGYKGLIDLARRSGHITSISAGVHYDDDDLWEYEEGTEARLRRIPGAEEGEPLHAYAIAKFVDGGHAYVVLPWSKVMKIRNGSQGWQTAVRYNKTDSSPWKTHEPEMAKKTAIRALAKYLPLSIEFMDALSADESKADYATFAMNPTEGLQTEGETIEGEVEDVSPEPESPPEDQAPEPEKTEAPEEKPKPKRRPKQEESPKEDDEADLPDQDEINDGLVNLIRRELDGAEDAATVELVIASYEKTIKELKGTAAYDAIKASTEARLKEVAQ